MVSLSKIRDARFWKTWRESGAVSSPPQIPSGHEVIHLDQLVNRCGFFRDGGDVSYACDHPKQGERGEDDQGREVGKCYAHSCPIATALSPGDEPLDRPYFGSPNWKYHTQDGKWMLVRTEDLGNPEVNIKGDVGVLLTGDIDTR